jgi:hypothetical protein
MAVKMVRLKAAMKAGTTAVLKGDVMVVSTADKMAVL